tara:strand:+ start:2052 stop:2471 length:420 start_codon:yes stop_codon:yes gene_type:complete
MKKQWCDARGFMNLDTHIQLYYHGVRGFFPQGTFRREVNDKIQQIDPVLDWTIAGAFPTPGPSGKDRESRLAAKRSHFILRLRERAMKFTKNMADHDRRVRILELYMEGEHFIKQATLGIEMQARYETYRNLMKAECKR